VATDTAVGPHRRDHRGGSGSRGGRGVQRALDARQLPAVPVDEGTLITGGQIALVTVGVVASMVGALGGLAGMRLHRSVDETGFGH